MPPKEGKQEIIDEPSGADEGAVAPPEIQALKFTLDSMPTFSKDRYALALSHPLLWRHYKLNFEFLEAEGINGTIQKFIRPIQDYIELIKVMPDWEAPYPSILDNPSSIVRVLRMFHSRELIKTEFYKIKKGRIRLGTTDWTKLGIDINEFYSDDSFHHQHLSRDLSTFEEIMATNALIANYNYALANEKFGSPTNYVGTQQVLCKGVELTRLPGDVIAKHSKQLNAIKLFVVLEHNYLKWLPDELFRLDSLISLRCRYNELTTLPWDAYAAKEASCNFEIDVWYNELSEVPEGIQGILPQLFFQEASLRRFGDDNGAMDAFNRAWEYRETCLSPEFQQLAREAAKPYTPADPQKTIVQFLIRKFEQLLGTQSEAVKESNKPKRVVVPYFGAGAGAGAGAADDEDKPSPTKRPRTG